MIQFCFKTKFLKHFFTKTNWVYNKFPRSRQIRVRPPQYFDRKVYCNNFQRCVAPIPVIEKPQTLIFHKVRSTVTVYIFLIHNTVTVLRTLIKGWHVMFYKRRQS